jgi:hypothetical protein
MSIKSVCWLCWWSNITVTSEYVCGLIWHSKCLCVGVVCYAFMAYYALKGSKANFPQRSVSVVIGRQQEKK